MRDRMFMRALTRYAETVKADGFEAGEKVIEDNIKGWPDFRRFAYAVAIMLRTKELLDKEQD